MTIDWSIHPKLTAAERVYAVGDIHGRLDLLLKLAVAIFDHAAGRRVHVVFLGDYVDRGPDSRSVVEFLMGAERDGWATCLMGNHEAMMAAAMSDPDEVGSWMSNGGWATLQSYAGEDPADHAGWMAGLPYVVRDSHRIYVHAGLLPGVELERQTPEACLWIRDRFLRARADELPCHVVHGHSPYAKPVAHEPELQPHRTNLDTGAFRTGVLTAGAFDPALPGGPIELLFARK